MSLTLPAPIDRTTHDSGSPRKSVIVRIDYGFHVTDTLTRVPESSTLEAHEVNPQKHELLEHVMASTSDLVSTGHPSPSQQTILASFNLVNGLLFDGAATPQVSRGPGGGLAVEWLVNRQSLTVHIVSESDVRVWAEDRSGHEIFEFETNSMWSPSDPGIQRSISFLKEISVGISHRTNLRTLA